MVAENALLVPLKQIADVLREGSRFLMMTHEAPDLDGLGSMFALSRCLTDLGKEVVTVVQKPIVPSLAFLRGVERAVLKDSQLQKGFDAVLALDCAERERLGSCVDLWPEEGPTINIDHHETNTLFGRFNLVDSNSSSTAELVYQLIRTGNFPLDPAAAENLFAAIQSDTGSFRFTNTTSTAMRISADLLDQGVSPWEIYLKSVSGYGPERLALLSRALGQVEFHGEGRIGMLVLSKEMIKACGARPSDSEGFVDYPRYIKGVELAVMILEKDDNTYKFSMRSNRGVNVADLAMRFGGGGHGRAAGFTMSGSLAALKRDFLSEAGRSLNETPG
ncbi:MAG: bifunctional oligoribonuclease/PAP phosphatase NrnA [Deltaproteobacteria bacterium]|nr:bifunctional oligoribonuclease/PAP phosphatase NrnA [Deltaproteobacteria bacterium]